MHFHVCHCVLPWNDECCFEIRFRFNFKLIIVVNRRLGVHCRVPPENARDCPHAFETLQRVASIQWAPFCSGHPSQPPFSQYKNIRHANFITANLILLNRIPTARFSSAGNKKRTQRTGITSIIPAVLAWLWSALCMIKTPDVCILILFLSDLGQRERHGSLFRRFQCQLCKTDRTANNNVDNLFYQDTNETNKKVTKTMKKCTLFNDTVMWKK